MPQPQQSDIDRVKQITGESRTLIEFVQSFASKTLAMAGLGFFLFVTVGLATMESDSVFGAELFGYAAAIVVTYVACEAWKKVAALRSLQSRALTTELSAQIDKAGG